MTVEGIENAEQLNRMRKCGCTEGQGYYFSMPMTVDSFQLSLDSEQDSDSKNGS
jgi:EAL domain-containing protein (putative c-di-GMP-specific phosphodiesterase class I)